MMGYLKGLLLALDQSANALLFGAPDETISARSYRRAQEGSKGWAFASKVIDMIFFWDKDHSRTSYESEKNRCHLPEGYREGGTC